MRIVGALAAVLMLASCSSDPAKPIAKPTTQAPTPTPTPTFTYPGTTWDVAKQGDFRQLDADLAGARSTCFAVIKDGKLVHDAYWGGTNERSTRPAYSSSSVRSWSSLFEATVTRAPEALSRMRSASRSAPLATTRGAFSFASSYFSATALVMSCFLPQPYFAITLRTDCTIAGSPVPAGDHTFNVTIGQGQVSETISVKAGETVEKDVVVGVGHAVVNAFYTAGGERVEG